jgi:hypothetical protein
MPPPLATPPRGSQAPTEAIGDQPADPVGGNAGDLRGAWGAVLGVRGLAWINRRGWGRGVRCA